MNLGIYGENLAQSYLERNKYLIIERNYFKRIGEIDIICSKRETVVFVEVKTRIEDGKGRPYEAVTPNKLNTIKAVGLIFASNRNLIDVPLQIDVISIELWPDKTMKEFLHFKNVW